MLNQAIKEINQLNTEFYEKHAESFDKSRKNNFWQGFLNTLKYIESDSKILDIGCGNGRYYEFLHQNGINIDYLGVDNIEKFIKIAQENYPKAKFEQKDIFQELEKIEDRYDLVSIFGVTHHIPNKEFRHNWILTTAQLVAPKGSLVVSFWNFNITKADQDFKTKNYIPESGDYFLGWKNDFSSHRFCHYFSDNEISEIIKLLTDFKIVEDYLEDDNRYLIFKKER